ncbi:response regulator [Idiomarina sp. HP20-50]|uniref:response regulator n=1 Tax=Idiomarina sp. HP20-50 TaxID=3070813 RepID=UPI00294B2748|nr:response regulator [Idiomarina sp. HP20-50]MDV6317093.1 response regulator [Idiomarina sp. HP20-50]
MRKVLIADDDFISLEVLKAMLTNFDIELLTAMNGQEALEQAEQRPELIFLDYEMPDMSGAEVCRQLRQSEKHKKTPIIAITSHQSASEMSACREAGMDATLHKPVSPEALSELMSEYLQ